MNGDARTPEYRIRAGGLRDAEEMADLTTQLGYPTTADQTRDRMLRLDVLQRGRILVAEAGGRVVGWIHVAAEHCLEAEPWAEVRGLVVDERWRGRGVGAGLIRQAEAWAREQRLTLLRLRTNVVRERAHAFYRRLGFRQLKTQHVFVKDLSSTGAGDGTIEAGRTDAGSDPLP